MSRRALGVTLLLGLAGGGAAQSAGQLTGGQSAPELTLDAALAQVDRAPSVTQAALAVQVAQGNLDAARAALGLTVTVSGNAAYAGPTSATSVGGAVTTTDGSLSGSAGVNVSLGLLPWSSHQTGLRSAGRSLTQAQGRLRDAQNAARLNVAQGYFAAVLAAEDTALAARTLALRQRQLAVAQAQQANGNATPEGVLSAQANVQTAQAAQLQAAASLDGARRSLSASLGTEVGAVNFSTRPPETFTLPDVTALVAQARAQRSEVIEAQSTLAAAQDNLAQEERDAALPELTASLRYGPAAGGGLSASFNLKQGTLGAGYSLPLGTGGGGTSGGSSSGASSDRLTASLSGSYVLYAPGVRAQLSAAQATVTQATLSLQLAEQNVELDVRTRYATAQSALLTVQTRATQVQVAALTLEAARTRLQAGTATADDVTAAELAAAQAERDLLSARVSAQLALLQLLNAAGGPA